MTEFEEHRFAALETFDWLPLDSETMSSEEYWQNVDFVVRSVHERQQYKHLPKLATTADMAHRWAF